MCSPNSKAFEQLRIQQEQRIAQCRNPIVREAALKALREVAKVDADCELLRRIAGTSLFKTTPHETD